MEELLSVNHVSIRIVTWNVGSQSPDKIKSINRLLRPENGTDIIAVGLQEIIDITKAKVFGKYLICLRIYLLKRFSRIC